MKNSNTQNKLKIVKVINNNKIELINFKNVAKINLQYRDRIILNFNHTITRNIGRAGSGEQGKFAGYYYIDKEAISNYDEIRDMLFSDEFAEYFARIEANGNVTGFVNMSEISTIKVSNHNLSVIFNLSHSVTSQRQNTSLLHSADSVLSSFETLFEFDNYVENLLAKYA